MEILYGLDGLRRLPHGSVITIGNYDGVHRGHQHLLAACRNLHAQHAHPAIAVVTFEPHPLTVIKPELAPPRLSPSAVKESLLCAQGVDYLVVLPPEPRVLNLTAEQFWALLRDDVRPSWIVEGSTFNFGKNRAGTIDRLREWAAPTSVRVHVMDGLRAVLLDLSIVTVNSSLVRWLLSHGRARDAAICLGHPYILQGQVVEGHRRGRTLGMPTANVDCGDQLVPADGVYAGRIRIGDAPYAVALSIGTMPTFGENRRQVEAHLIGFDGDLYGQTIAVEMLDWVRDQRRFANIDLLKHQMYKDLRFCAERLSLDPAREIATTT